MSRWKRQPVGDHLLYQSTLMAWLPGITQGFTTRHGGVSRKPYDSLNLGAHVGDVLTDVETNRQRVWDDLGFTPDQVVLAEQVHGDKIAVVTEGSDVPTAGVDALITVTNDLLLMLFYADCVPIYLVDPTRRAIGLVHAGWRGTAASIVGKTVQAMSQSFDCLPSSLIAAVGPSIGGDSYEVGAEVADQFRNFPGGRDVGSATAVMPRSDLGGTYNLNLRQIIFTQLLAAGVRPEYISVCDEDTYRNRRDFFSYRRDGKASGRMAAFLAMRSLKNIPSSR